MRLRLAIAGAAVLLAMTLEAQEGLRDRDRTLTASRTIATDLRRSRFRFGPFYLLSTFQLGDIGYEEQFFVPTSEQNAGLSFGVSAPQRLYFVPTRKSVYSLEVTPTYSVFRNTSSGTKGQFGYTTRADAQYLFNHLYLDLYVSKSNALRAYTGEIDRLVTVASRTVGTSGEIKYSSRTSLTFQASTTGLTHPFNRYQPTAVPVELLDRIDQTYRATFVHKTFPLTSLSLIGERSNYKFRFTSFKDSHRTFFGPALNYDSGLTTFHLEAGNGRVVFADPAQRDYSGVLGNVRMSRKGASWVVSLSGLRDTDFSILNNTNLYVMDRAGIDAQYAATRKLTLRFGSNGGIDRYRNAAIAPSGMLIFRRDTMSFTWVGFTYLIRRLRAGVDFGYYTRDTNFELFEKRDGIRTLLHLSFTP